MADASKSGMGHESAAAFISTQRSEPYPTIDASKVRLPQPFIVCIMGASRGIGAGIAQSYAKAGASGLMLASRRTSGLEETASQCKELNNNVDIEIVPCDITSAASVEELAKKTKAKFGGRLDVLVVNSGFSGDIALKVTEADPVQFQQAIDVVSGLKGNSFPAAGATC